MAKELLEQKGIGWERSWPIRQMSFLDHARRDFDLLLPDTFLLVHNVRSERSRRLRCEWYEEQLFWNTGGDGRRDEPGSRGRDLEDITLAFVLAGWRKEGKLLPADDAAWGERMLTTDELQEKEREDDTGSSRYFVKMHPSMPSIRRRYKASR